MSPLASGDRRLAPPFRPAAAHDSDHVTARLGRSGAYRRLSALRLRTTPTMSPLASAGAAPTAAFPPCGCARPPIMSPLASGDRRLAPPLRPAAAHDLRYELDVVGIGAAARADDVTAGVEQRRVLARHGLRSQLVGHGVARGHRQPSVRSEERRVGKEGGRRWGAVEANAV